MNYPISSPRTAGISLIELVVAMAVFALIAVMGLQSLTGTVRISERLTEIDARTADVGNALALLRNDLTALIPMLFYPPQSAPRPAVDWRADTGRLGLSLAGQSSFTPLHTDRHRAEWLVDPENDTLVRRVWPTLNPNSAEQLSVDVPVLDGATALRLRTYWPELGWVDGHRPPLSLEPIVAVAEVDQDEGGAPPPVYFSTLPIAVEVTITTTQFGALRLVETLR